VTELVIGMPLGGDNGIADILHRYSIIVSALLLAGQPPDVQAEKSNNIAHSALDFRSLWSVHAGLTKERKHGSNCSRCCHQSSSR
jgi:hypothetical protein